jgi:large subunit ribosomal protein L6
MSRIGRKPIVIPNGIEVIIEDRLVTVKDNNNSLSKTMPLGVKFCFDDENANILKVIADESMSETINIKAMHGLARSLINSMVEGVNSGFKKELEIIGIGYKAKINNNIIELSLGYSHLIKYKIPENINVVVNNNTKISVSGFDKQLVGEVAAKIRRFKKPDSFKGKGIRYSGEYIRIKEGKKTGK